MLSRCMLCPRCCGVDRVAGQKGFCAAGNTLEIFRHGPHHGEEPPISGTRGSGTVFFSRCTLRCIYCQNHPWSQEGRGREYTVAECAGILRGLAEAGCHNWNLVSPTPWLPLIREAREAAAQEGFALPFVYNTSGFERRETLLEFGDCAAIFLTDLRYSRPESAREGSGNPAYVQVARDALRTMWEMRGPLRVDRDGIAVSGTVCRLLILPGRASEAVENLEWLARNIGRDIAVSVMAQYVPAFRAQSADTWNRAVNREEYDTVRSAVEDLGFDNGWVQEFDAETPRGLIGFEMKGS